MDKETKEGSRDGIFLVVGLLICVAGLSALFYFSLGDNSKSNADICNNLQKNVSGNLTNYPTLENDMLMVSNANQISSLGYVSGKLVDTRGNNIVCEVRYKLCWGTGQNTSICNDGYSNPSLIINKKDLADWING